MIKTEQIKYMGEIWSIHLETEWPTARVTFVLNGVTQDSIIVDIRHYGLYSLLFHRAASMLLAAATEQKVKSREDDK